MVPIGLLAVDLSEVELAAEAEAALHTTVVATPVQRSLPLDAPDNTSIENLNIIDPDAAEATVDIHQPDDTVAAGRNGAHTTTLTK